MDRRRREVMTSSPEEYDDSLDSDGDNVELRKLRKKKRRLSKKPRTAPRLSALCNRPNRLVQAQRNRPIFNILELQKAVDNNDVLQVQLQLQKAPSQLLLDPESKENTWHYALNHERNQVVDYLLQSNDDTLLTSFYKIQRTDISGERNALHMLIEQKDDIRAKKLIKLVKSTEQKKNMVMAETPAEIEGQRPRLMSCLHLAAYNGLEKLIRFFLKSCFVDVNTLNDKEDTALMFAARCGHVETVETLIRNDAHINLKNDKGSTALHWAVRYGHNETVKLLLQKGADPNTKRKIGLIAPLITASAYGYNDIVRLLLSKSKCDIHIKDSRGRKAIHYAAKEGNIDVLNTLLENDTSQIDDKDKQNDTPLLLAAKTKDNTDAVYHLITYGADDRLKNLEGNDSWNYALDSENTDLLDSLMAACIEQEKNINERQPLHIAVEKGRIDMIEFLLKYQQGPLVEDSKGNTFFHIAALHDRFNIIERFHKYGNINAQNKKKDTPLHIACRNGFYETIKSLLKYKADASLKNGDEENSLHVAASSIKINVASVRKLVSYTKKVHTWESLSAVNSNGSSCLHLAAEFAEPDVIWEFRFVKLDTYDNEGYSPLHKAVRAGQPESLNMMLKIVKYQHMEAAITNKQSSNKKETVLPLAADEGLSSCVEPLIDLGADISMKDSDGNTVLHRLTIATVDNQIHLKRHLEVFDTILEMVVKWWCQNKKIVYPDSNDNTYKELQKEATLYLVDEILNFKELSVINLSFMLGASDIIYRLLMMDNVTMFKEPSKYRFDISRLKTQTSRNASNVVSPVNDKLSGKEWLIKQMEKKRAAKIPNIPPVKEKNRLLIVGNVTMFKEPPKYKFDISRLKPQTSRNASNVVSPANDKLSGMEWLIKQMEKKRAAKIQDILNIPPVKKIELHYNSIVFWTYFCLMILHVMYMIVFTYVGVDLLAKLRDDNMKINSSDSARVLMLCIVPIEPILIVLYLSRLLWHFVKGSQSCNIKCECSFSTLWRAGEILLYVIYAAIVIIWIVLFSVRCNFQDYVLGAALCIGWLYSIKLIRGFKDIGYFFSLLHSIILKDFKRFTIIYVFVLCAFGFAFHVLFQISPDVVKVYKTPFDTLFFAFNLMIGRGELFDDEFEKNMKDAGRELTYLKIYYVIYIILSSIILTNLLIAMMNDSYRKFRDENHLRWRIDSVILGVDTERNLMCNCLRNKLSDVRIEPVEGSDECYIYIDCKEVDEYRSQRNIETENTERRLCSRMDELEVRANDRQEKTTTMLQQIEGLANDLQEKTNSVHQQIGKLINEMKKRTTNATTHR